MIYILECDSFSVDALNTWLESINESDHFYILHKSNTNTKFSNLRSDRPNITNITYEFFESYKPDYSIQIDYIKFLNKYYEAGIPFFLLDRDGYFPKYGLGVNNGIGHYINMVRSIITFFKEKKIDGIYFRTTPHHSIEWLLAVCADYYEINVLVTQRHILPWRYSLAKGFGRKRILISPKELEEINQKEINHLDIYLQKLNGSYFEAAPSYELKRNKKVSNLLKPSMHIKEIISRPHHYIQKFRAFKFYKTNSVQVNTEKKYIYFPLHVQPERTSLPEGFEFHNQLLIVQMLRQYLPEDIHIFVKEHPSSFSLRWSPKFRTKRLYEQLIKIPNVKLVSLEQDNFELVDNALAVCTITGTVGIEAFARKVPVIYFGVSWLLAKGVHVYKDMDGLVKFLSELIENKVELPVNVRDELVTALKYSVSGLDDDLEQLDYYNFVPYEEKAHLFLIGRYFNELCKEQ